MFQVKKDPSDSCTLKNLPCSAQGRGVFRIWGKSGLVKAWFKQNTSFVALLYRRGVSEPGFPAWGLCFHAGRPPVHGSTGSCVQLPCRGTSGLYRWKKSTREQLGRSEARACLPSCCATARSWKPRRACVGRASTYPIPSDYTTEVH